MASIRSIKDAATGRVEIKDPETQKGLGIFFTLAGPEHPARKKIDYDRQRAIRAKFQQTQRVELTDPEEDEESARDTLAASILGWEGWDEDGVPVQYSPAEASAIAHDDDRGWLRAQLQQAMNDRARFITRSATA